MYEALRNENSNMTAQDARDRIEKDCVGIWTKRTILENLPDEAKDQKKQKAGRLRQKEANSAAVSAAPAAREEKKKRIIIDTEGKPIQNEIRLSPSPLTTAPLSTNDDPYISDNDDNQLQNNEDLTPFEFSLQSIEVVYYLFLSDSNKECKDDRVWFNGTLHKRTGKVISASIGRITSQQSTIMQKELHQCV